jgi:hypothetical protein
LATVAFPCRPSRHRRSLNAGPRTPLTTSVCQPARHLVDVPCDSGTASRHGSIGCPPCAESPFAPLGYYPSGDGIYRHLRRHYPSLVATTGSCARPNPSHVLQPWPRSVGPCRLLPAPAGRWSFPTLSPQSLYRCLDPYPVLFLRCSRPFLPEGHRPHVRSDTLSTAISSRIATSAGHAFRGCSHFIMFRLPYLLDPQVAPTASRFVMGGRAVYTTR